MKRRRRPVLSFVILLLLGSMLTFAMAACGEEEGISAEDHAQIQVGMTLDEVEGVLGQPERTHVTGASDNPSIFWYFAKTEGEGLVKITFEQGRVTSVAPYDQSFEVGE